MPNISKIWCSAFSSCVWSCGWGFCVSWQQLFHHKTCCEDENETMMMPVFLYEGEWSNRL